MNKPQVITTREWASIMVVPEIREEYCINFGDKPEDFAAKMYGAKFAFESKRRRYSGDLYVIYNDTLSNRAFSLISHKHGFEVLR